MKLDRSLTKTLERNYKSQVIMENTIKMCHGLTNTNTLAEGIETEGQLKLLGDYHCKYGQGYYFSRPIPLRDFEKLLESTQNTEE